MLRSSASAILAILLTAALAGQADAAPGEAFPYDVPGGTVVVKGMPDQSTAVQDAVSQTLLLEDPETTLALSAERCPTRQLILTAERKATMAQRWAKAGNARDPKGMAAMFIPGSATQDCRIWLNARTLHRADEAQICNIVEHELGHARGLDHTKSGLMAPRNQLLPVPGYCDWAFSSWVDG